MAASVCEDGTGSREKTEPMKRHVVLVTVAGARYAIPSSYAIEVIPVVRAQSLPAAPDWVRGAINYRGRLILAVDFSSLLGCGACPSRMANRILVVRTREESVTGNSEVGLLVEAVLGSERVEFDDSELHAALAPDEFPFLTQVTLIDSESLQLVDTTQLPNPFDSLLQPEAG